VLLNCPPGLREAPAAGAALVKPEEYASFYNGPPCRTLSQAFARFAPGRPYESFTPARFRKTEPEQAVRLWTALVRIACKS
jgi:hypothetical protein